MYEIITFFNTLLKVQVFDDDIKVKKRSKNLNFLKMTQMKNYFVPTKWEM